MNGRAVGAGSVLLGAYLLYSNFDQSRLFSEGPQAVHHTALAALGALLLTIGVVFLYKNLK